MIAFCKVLYYVSALGLQALKINCPNQRAARLIAFVLSGEDQLKVCASDLPFQIVVFHSSEIQM